MTASTYTTTAGSFAFCLSIKVNLFSVGPVPNLLYMCEYINFYGARATDDGAEENPQRAEQPHNTRTGLSNEIVMNDTPERKTTTEKPQRPANEAARSPFSYE